MELILGVRGGNCYFPAFKAKRGIVHINIASLGLLGVAAFSKEAVPALHADNWTPGSRISGGAVLPSSSGLLWELESVIVSDDEGLFILGQISSALKVITEEGPRLLLADQKFNHIKLFTFSGDFVSTLGQAGEGPGDIPSHFLVTVDSENRLYVAGMGATVSLLNSDGTWLKHFKRGDPFNIVQDIKVDAAGNLYLVAPNLSNHFLIHKYAPNQEGYDYVTSFGESYVLASRSYDPKGEQYYAGGSIDISQDGYLYFSQRVPFKLQKYTLDGKLILSCEEGDNIDGKEFVPEPPEIEYGPGGRMRLKFPAISAHIWCLLGDRILNCAYSPEMDGRRTTLITVHNATDLKPACEPIVLDGVRTIVGVDLDVDPTISCGRVFLASEDLDKGAKIESYLLRF